MACGGGWKAGLQDHGPGTLPSAPWSTHSCMPRHSRGRRLGVCRPQMVLQERCPGSQKSGEVGDGLGRAPGLEAHEEGTGGPKI